MSNSHPPTDPDEALKLAVKAALDSGNIQRVKVLVDVLESSHPIAPPGPPPVLPDMTRRESVPLGLRLPTPKRPKQKVPKKRPEPEKQYTQEEIEAALAKIVVHLEAGPGSLVSEKLRAQLQMAKKLFQSATGLGVSSDQLKKEGKRRSTVYALPARHSKAQEEGRVLRRKKP